MPSHTAVFDALADLTRRDNPCALVTVVRAKGSVPNTLGAKMLVSPDGTLVAGTIGGGLIEHQALAAAATAINDGKCCSFVAKLTPEEAGGIGMNCGGSVEVFIDVQTPSPQLILCGAGHISVALAAMTRGLGYRVTVVDEREDWANRDKYPSPDVAVVTQNPAVFLREHGAPTHAFVVIATHAGDLEVMDAAAQTDARYVGLVASRRKAITLSRELLERSEATFTALEHRFYAPIGLNLGGREPEAVALSILAEVQALLYGKSGEAMTLDPKRLREAAGAKNVNSINTQGREPSASGA